MRFWMLKKVLQVMASREPDFLIGDPSDPQTRRWYLTPKFLRPIFAIYLHEWRKSDGDVPHDHPYLFNISIILSRGYWEHQKNDFAIFEPRLRWEGDIIFHFGWTPHRVELIPTSVVPSTTSISKEEFDKKKLLPITLFICGPRVRTWGFHCPKGWRPFHEYIAIHSYGNRVGKGCEGLE